MNCLRLILLLLVCSFPFSVKTQVVFSRIENHPNPSASSGMDGLDVIQTPDSGYFVFGNFYQTSGNRDLLLSRTDKFGDVLWSKTFGDVGFDLGASVVYSSDGGCLLAGVLNSTTQTYTMWLIKTDSLGIVQWQKQYGGTGTENTSRLISTTDGGYLIAGSTQGYNASSNANAFFVKINSIGDTLWTSEVGSTNGPEQIWDVSETSDGGYIGIGQTTSFGPNSWYCVKINSAGNLLWTRVFYSGTSLSFGHAVAELPNGNILFAGTTNNYASLHATIIETDANGDTLWTHSYSPLNDIKKILLLPNGHFIITGGCDGGQKNGFLAEIDSSGNIIWGQQYNSGAMDYYLYGLIKTSDDGYAVCGNTVDVTNGGYLRLLFLKTDSLGSTSCSSPLSITNVVSPIGVTTGGNRFYKSNYENFSWNTQPQNIVDSITCINSNGIMEINSPQVLIPYPNPTTDVATIDLPGNTSDELMLKIFNLQGEMVAIKKGNGGTKIFIDKIDFTPGLYFFTLENKNGEIYYGKIIFQ